jgi:hypothetical protein
MEMETPQRSEELQWTAATEDEERDAAYSPKFN